jgi:hypothetical protein
VEEINMRVVDNPDSPKAEWTFSTHNIATYIGKRPASAADKGKQIFFAGLDTGINDRNYRRNIVFPAFKAACRPAGFVAASSGYEPKECRVRIVCNRSEQYDPRMRGAAAFINAPTQEGTGGSRATRTNRPLTKEEKCPFQFPIYWHEERKLWYIWSKNAGCLKHCGHCQLLPDEVPASISELSSEDRELVNNLFNIHAQSATTQAFLSERTGLDFTKDQIRHLYTKYRNSTETESFDPATSTPADRLLHNLESNPDCSFYALFARWDTDLLRVPQLRSVYREPGGPEQEVETNEAAVTDATDSAIAFAQRVRARTLEERVRDNLSITNSGGQILLAVAWTTKAAQGMLAKFPEATVADVHMGTNAEKRPLMLIIGKTATNKAFAATYALLGNMGRCMFNFVWEVAHPKLHGLKTIERNRACATDGDVNEYLPFIALCGEGALYKRASWRLCCWHKIDRGLKGIRCHPPGNDKGNVFHTILVRWLYSFTDDVENMAEYQDSRYKLGLFLEQSEVVEALGETYIKSLTEWLPNSFFTAEVRVGIMFYERMYIRDFDLRTTSIAESEGAAMKNSSLGPRPNHSIDAATDAINKLAKRRFNRHSTASALALSSQALSFFDERVYDHMTIHAAKSLKAQYDQADQYFFYRANASLFFVKRKSYRDPPTGFFDERFYTYIIPKYERTRIVEVREGQQLPGKLFLHCSCGYYDRHGIVCRHQYAILSHGEMPGRQAPNLGDVAVRWLNLYGYFYGRDRTYTRKFDQAIEQEGCGAEVSTAWLSEDNIAIGTGDCSEDFFTASLHSVSPNRRIRAGNWWSVMEGIDLHPTSSSRQQLQELPGPFGLSQHVHLAPDDDTFGCEFNDGAETSEDGEAEKGRLLLETGRTLSDPDLLKLARIASTACVSATEAAKTREGEAASCTFALAAAAHAAAVAAKAVAQNPQYQDVNLVQLVADTARAAAEAAIMCAGQGSASANNTASGNDPVDELADSFRSASIAEIDTFTAELCLPQPSQGALEAIKEDVIRPGLQYQGLNPLLQQLAAACVNEHEYYKCKSTLQNLHAELLAVQDPKTLLDKKKKFKRHRPPGSPDRRKTMIHRNSTPSKSLPIKTMIRRKHNPPFRRSKTHRNHTQSTTTGPCGAMPSCTG